MQWRWMKKGEPAGDYAVEDTHGMDPDTYTESCAKTIGPDGIMGKDPLKYDGQWGNYTAHMEGGTNYIAPLTFREKLYIRFVLYTARAVYRIKKFFKKES